MVHEGEGMAVMNMTQPLVGLGILKNVQSVSVNIGLLSRFILQCKNIHDIKVYSMNIRLKSRFI